MTIHLSLVFHINISSSHHSTCLLLSLRIYGSWWWRLSRSSALTPSSLCCFQHRNQNFHIHSHLHDQHDQILTVLIGKQHKQQQLWHHEISISASSQPERATPWWPPSAHHHSRGWKRESSNFWQFNPIWPSLFWCIRDLGGGTKYLWAG